ncbi:unnamed protein product [Oppiella nova]|uniref:G-protein coupled receptors family 1 profile domain-containing protein n=1 Tax=Oppiella nova TaxID=334625 RepID=A0A7R9M2K3_9ACAR|nr:unnamed protein product [Oppiella nova]CAG2169542.1 unnamed protein product [Oppiella nova]
MDTTDESNVSFIANPLLIEYLKTSDNFESDYQMNATIKYSVLMFSYSVIFLVSLIGNSLVCKVILCGQTSRTLTNTLIANLAISDLLMTIINIPFNIARFILDNWPFGQVLCVLVPFTQSTSVHCSSISMMFIAIERYRILVCNLHPTHHTYIFGHTISMAFILLGIWLMSALISIPHGIYNQVVEYDNIGHHLIRCRVVYPEPRDLFRQRLTLLSFMTQYLIPIVLTCGCYLRIGLFLWQRKIIGVISEIQRTTIIRIKRRRIKMLVLVVVVFAICWLPLNIYHLLTDFDAIDYSLTVFFITHCFAMSSVCYNPFIYCWLNKKFKQRVKNLMYCVSTRSQQSVSIPLNTFFDVVDVGPEIIESSVGDNH